jgi:hypothetical protein
LLRAEVVKIAGLSIGAGRSPTVSPTEPDSGGKMDLIELYVSYGNRVTEEWDSVAKLDIDYFDEPDFSLGLEAFKEQERDRFKKAPLPNGEVIEISVLYRAESTGFTLHVKQEGIALLQVLCEGMPCVGFRTLAGSDIGIQVHPRGSFQG